MSMLSIEGLVAEEVARIHLEKCGFKVVRIGKEYIDPRLAEIDSLFVALKNILNSPGVTFQGISGLPLKSTKYSLDTHDIWIKFFSKLPDFFVWKVGYPTSILLVEVKYRSDCAFLNVKVDDKNIKYFEYSFDRNSDPLDIYKYKRNIEIIAEVSLDQSVINIARNNNSSLINYINFFCYLICKDSGKCGGCYRIFVGKVYENRIDFYDASNMPAQFRNTLWTASFSEVARYISSKLSEVFDSDFLNYLRDKPEKVPEEIGRII